MTIKTRIQIRRGNLADLPTLEAGEPGFTLDTHALYIGDGASNWLISSGSSGGGSGATGDMLKSTYDADIDGSVELADAILGASAAGSSKYYGTNSSSVVGFHDLPTAGSSSSAAYASHYPCQGRLTLTSATPVTTADVTAATDIYFSPYLGDTIALYDGADWHDLTFSEQHIHLSLTLTPIVSTATKTLTDLEDTSQLIVGMEISGSGIAANSTIASIDSATQVTMNNYGASNGHFNVTFKVPANKNLDIFAFDNTGTLKLEFVQWTNDTTRSAALTTQNGVLVKSGAATRRYLGSVRTTATAGQTEDSLLKRFVWNAYNRVPRALSVKESSATWSYSGGARYANANAANRAEVLIGLSIEVATVIVHAGVYAGSTPGAGAWVAVGLDSTAGYPTECILAPAGCAGYAMLSSAYSKVLPIGYHYLAWVESGGGVAFTFIGSPYAGLSGRVFS